MTKKPAKRKKKIIPEEVTFEEALSRLEKIVSQLESGKTSLEDSLSLFEEGIGLSRRCHEKLKEVQKKVEILLESSKGDFISEPFHPSDESE
jgi:exodeoxyribonuclease VII small subunit